MLKGAKSSLHVIARASGMNTNGVGITKAATSLNVLGKNSDGSGMNVSAADMEVVKQGKGFKIH